MTPHVFLPSVAPVIIVQSSTEKPHDSLLSNKISNDFGVIAPHYRSYTEYQHNHMAALRALGHGLPSEYRLAERRFYSL